MFLTDFKKISRRFSIRRLCSFLCMFAHDFVKYASILIHFVFTFETVLYIHMINIESMTLNVRLTANNDAESYIFYLHGIHV